MISLFIDTSCDELVVAVLKDGKILSKKTKRCKNEHSVYTVSYIDESLKEANLEPNDVDYIYVVSGPGSFTGVRIGTSIAKTYAYLLNKKVILVSSLKALALSVDNNIVVSVIDASNNNYYMGVYDMFDNDISYEKFVTVETVLSKLDKYKDAKLISNKEFKILDNQVEKVELDIENIVKYYYKNGEVCNVHDIKPNYLKLPQVYEDKNV